MNSEQNRRILLVDDTPAIHEDFRRTLMPSHPASELDELGADLFDEELRDLPQPFELQSASQGQVALAMVREQLEAGRPFAVAFVDMRMPPGWDGVETVERMWQLDPRLQVVICTAYSDYSWGQLSTRLQVGDRLLLLKKPFDPVEVYQLASTLTAKWQLSQQAASKMASLEKAVAARTAQLAAANEALQARTDQLAVANQALRVDIARRRAAESEARDAHGRIADILEFLPDATFVLNNEKRVIAWNRALVQLTGVVKEEMLGRGEYAYGVPFYGEPRPILIDMLDVDEAVRESRYGTLTRKGQTLSTEMKLVVGGEERLLWSAAAPLFDLKGGRVGAIQTIREITSLRRSEQERSKMEARLEHCSLLSSLIVQLNHDLRTPITPLFALLPLVREKTQDQAMKRMLEVCEKSANQILELSAKSIAMVRLSSEAARQDLVPVLLAPIAQQCLQNNAGLFTPKRVTCNCSEIDPTLTVLGEPDQLALLFDNLLSNAARYAREGGTVCMWALNAAGMVTVAVQDDGAGLAPEHCELIFDPFFKVAAAQSAGSQGLGLAVCKRIVLNHMGTIWAESGGLGRGATFFFTLKEAR